MIARRTVLWLGLAQLISWGITYYLIGGFGEAIAADVGWTRDVVYGGFSAALLMMALTSPIAGRWIDRHGGRRVMTAGSLLNAAGCLGLALGHSAAAYYAAWIALGAAMRLTLYDAAFAALARIAGAGARRAMAQITLLGGLASTVFWPLGHSIAQLVGWRGALVVYAGFALATVPLHLAIPDTRHDPEVAAAPVASRSRGGTCAGCYRRYRVAQLHHELGDVAAGRFAHRRARQLLPASRRHMLADQLGALRTPRWPPGALLGRVGIIDPPGSPLPATCRSREAVHRCIAATATYLDKRICSVQNSSHRSQ